MNDENACSLDSYWNRLRGAGRRCESLTSLKLKDATVTSANIVGAGAFVAPEGRHGAYKIRERRGADPSAVPLSAEVARYIGSANIDDAANFRCSVPK